MTTHIVCALIPTVYLLYMCPHSFYICVLIPTMCPYTYDMCPYSFYVCVLIPTKCVLIPTIYVSSFRLYMYLIQQVTLQFFHYFDVSLDLVYASSCLLYVCPHTAGRTAIRAQARPYPLRSQARKRLGTFPPSLSLSLSLALFLSLPLARSLSRCAYIPSI